MRAALLQLISLSLLACGAPAPQWPQPLAGAYEIPLFMTAEAPWVLVEAQVNQGAPLLFMLSTRAGPGALTRSALKAAGLKPQGALEKATARLERLDLGPLTLRGVTLAAVGPLGRVHDRSIDGILGWDLLKSRVIEVDRGAGALRIMSWAPPMPPNAQRLPARWSGSRWIFEGSMGKEALSLEIALAAPYSGVDREEIQALEGAGLRPDLKLERLKGGFGVDGVLSYPAFAPATLRFDTHAGTIHAWSSPPRAPWRRSEALAPCESGGCLRGYVERARRGRVDLRLFSEIETPKGYWLRVDLGRATPRTALVRLEAKEARLTITDPALDPRHLRAEGEAIEVIDAVRLGAPCAGVVCTR